MTETLLPIVQKINGYLSDYILVALLIAVGLWYSIKTRFVQVRPRRHLLDVGHRLPRHGDHLRGSHARAGNAHRG